MKRIVHQSLAILVCLFAQSIAVSDDTAAQTAPALASRVVIADVGFAGSEAARYDPWSDRLLVSNLGERGEAKDGFLSILSPDGALLELKWIGKDPATNVMRDPLGFIVAKDSIFVADVHEVHEFARDTGVHKKSIPIPGSVRLNDIAIAPDGTLYVSDSGNDENPGALFRISPRGVVTPFVPRDAALERVNGVAVLKDGTIVHGGRGVNLVYRNKAGEILREVTLPEGRIDGIVAMDDGGLLVAAQAGKSVYRLRGTSTKVEVVADAIEVPAAIGFDPTRNLLYVPQIRAASVTIVPVR